MAKCKSSAGHSFSSPLSEIFFSKEKKISSIYVVFFFMRSKNIHGNMRMVHVPISVNNHNALLPSISDWDILLIYISVFYHLLPADIRYWICMYIHTYSTVPIDRS